MEKQSKSALVKYLKSLLGSNVRRAKSIHTSRVDDSRSQLEIAKKYALDNVDDLRDDYFNRVKLRADTISKARNLSNATRLGSLAGLGLGGYYLDQYLKSGSRPYSGPYRRNF